MTEVLEEIKGRDTICHYKHFCSFSATNSIVSRVGFSKMVNLLRLFAE
jgi:hypothetical protein